MKKFPSAFALTKATLPVAVWALPLFALLFTTPIIIEALGPTGYGYYTIAAAVIAFAILPPANRVIARFAGSAGADVIVLLRKMVQPFSIAIALNVIIIVAFESIWPTGIGQLDSIGLAITLLIITTALVLGVANQTLVGVLQLNDRWPKAAICLIMAGVIFPLLGVLVVKSGGNWRALLVTQVVVSFVTVCVLTFIARSFLQKSDAIAVPVEGYGSGIGAYLLRVGASGAVGSAMVLTERFIIGGLSGAQAAGFYSIAFSLALMIHASLNSAWISLPFHFRLSVNASSGDRLHVTYERALRLTIGLTGLLTALFLWVGDRFLEVWLGPIIAVNVVPLLPPLAIAMSVFALAIPQWMLADVRGKEKYNLGLMVGVASVWLAALLAIGNLGEPISMALARTSIILPYVAYVIVVERDAFGGLRKKTWFESLAKVAIASSIAWLAAEVTISTSWSGVVVSAFCATVGYCIVAVSLRLFQIADFASDRSDA